MRETPAGRTTYQRPALLARRLVVACGILLALTAAAPDWSDGPVPRRVVVGESIAAVIDELRTAGAPIAYSTATLPASLRVRATPTERSILGLVHEILRPHELTLREVDGLYVVAHRVQPAERDEPGRLLLDVRDIYDQTVIPDARIDGLPASAEVRRSSDGGPITIRLPAGRYGVTVRASGYSDSYVTLSADADREQRLRVRLSPLVQPLTEVVVAASRYELMRDSIESPTSIDRQSIMQIPDTGDDPVRAVQRLPGVAASGVSARSHLRGGTERETGIVLDGHRLLNPFHVRDYQNLFSAIDVRAIEGIEVYTGGFPVQYGDLTGGLVLVDTLSPEERHQGEFGLSVYNTSLLSAGQFANGDAEWVVSGRRGNLDLVLNKEIGEPYYHDLYGKFLLHATPYTTLSLNVLQVKDSVTIIPANEPDEREQTINDTRNSQFWISWKQQWSDSLSSQTVLSANDLISGRHALVNDLEKIVGQLSDERTFGFYRIKQDWTLDLGERHHLGWGAAFQHLDADYDYSSEVEYFGLYRNFPGQPNARSRDIAQLVDGDTLAFYVTDRWLINKRLIADLGLRWDKQSYTDTKDNGQYSPRASLMYRLNPRTRLRLSWGRYHQSQGANELQVEDGMTRFFPAQRFDQSILGIEYQLNPQYSLRGELYVKTSKSLRPRYENLFNPLTVIPELEPDRTLIAAQRADLRGIEVSAAYEGSNGLDWWASYTLAKAQDTVNGREYPRSWDQRHALQLGVALRGERWSYSVAAKIHSGWPMTAISAAPTTQPGGPAIVIGERNAERYGSFYSLDMRLDYRRRIPIGYFSWFLEITNATDRQNPCCVDFDLVSSADGQPLETKNDYWFPLLPATGILIEF